MNGFLLIIPALVFIFLVVQVDRKGTQANRWWHKFNVGQGGFEKYDLRLIQALVWVAIIIIVFVSITVPILARSL